MKSIFSGNRYANVTSTLALVVALGGTGAYAANTIGSKDIRNGQVKNADLARNAVTGAKVRNRTLTGSDFKTGELPKGAKGDTGASGAQGPAGPSLPGTLPSGQTLQGAYAFSGYYRGTSPPDQYDTGPADGVITFQIPLATAPTLVLIPRKQSSNAPGDPPAQCPGTIGDPQALRGYLCVYESGIANNNGLEAFSTFNGAQNTATRFGVGLNIDGPFDTNAVHRTSKGTWAVTAP